MSVNKYMHPRNIYKTPPNFKQMAIEYPEFRKYVTQDITGKIRIDFKNNETLRALSTTLLKKDFGLDVNIPLNHLIPTIPLRLNYILWIEDLLNIVTEDSDTNQEVYGIDIGTGASCIYPLLAAKIHNWHMKATEIDLESVNTARENVQKNNLQNLISIKQTEDDTILKNILDNRMYDFCMCNPPFFSSTSELNPFLKARTNNRTLPRNAISGTTNEVVVPGGEVEFIKKLIMESVEVRTQLRIFTTMIGHKSSLVPLKALLREVEAVSFKQTEFHQGHTTRWGLAWTFFNIDLRKIPQATVAAGKKKSKPPLKYSIPGLNEEIELISVVTKIRELLQTLQMDYEEMKSTKTLYAFHVTAKENTWSHQRRKRRQLKLPESGENIVSTPNETRAEPMDLDSSGESAAGNKRCRNDTSDDDDDEYYNVKKFRTNEHIEVYLKINVIVIKTEHEFVLEMSLIEGAAPKDSVHQVMQYFKNNLKF